ncbi:MAG TPA: MFS transporter, partial [Xanthobacteraceae bacterium]
IAAMLGAALTVPVLGSHRAKRFALIAALVSGALGARLAAFSTAAAALAGALLVGLGIAATPTVVSAHARDRCSANDYPKVFSFASAALGAGQLVGPVAGGALADVFGTAAVPLFAAAAYLLAALFAACDAAVADRTQR